MAGSVSPLLTMEELGMEHLYQEIASLDGILFGQHEAQPPDFPHSFHGGLLDSEVRGEERG